MRPLRYSINVTLDGCVDHQVGIPDPELHAHAVANLEWADALLFGRITYQMMESAFREPVPGGMRPEWMEAFARTMRAAKKQVVSTTLASVDWNAELVRGDLASAVLALKAMPGRGVFTGGVTLPFALAELGLIDEYEFIVQPRVAGRGPSLLAGLSHTMELQLVSRKEFASGNVAMMYVPKRA
jgi:dihydrofolate reductase